MLNYSIYADVLPEAKSEIKIALAKNPLPDLWQSPLYQAKKNIILLMVA